MSVKKFLMKFLKEVPLPDILRSKLNIYMFVDRILLSSSEIKDAEENPEIISKLLNRKRKEVPTTYKQIENSALNLLQGLDCREIEIQREKMLFCYFAYGFTPNEYVCYGLKGKDIRSYVSERESVKLAYKLNRCTAMEMLNDKFRTYNVLKKYYKRDIITIEDEKDYERFLHFVDKHKEFVKKNDMESCGRGVELIQIHIEEQEKRMVFERLLKEIKRTNKKIILEELVRQSDAMAKYNSSSVNTVRCITLKTSKGIITPFCFMKVGRNGSFIDNGGAGGLLIGINEESGVLNTDAIDENGVRYHKHPDTDVVFKGTELPAWNEMLSLCIEMAEVIDSAKWIGWDLAHTDKGWVIIEGNGATEVIGPQATTGQGIREKMNIYLKDVQL